MAILGPGAGIALNLTLYYAGWVACVAGAATGRWVSGSLLAVALAGLHLLLADRAGIEMRSMVVVTVVGYVVDSGQTALGLLVFAAGQPLPWLAPPWIAALWMLFAATLRYALYGLRERPHLAAALGATGGPAAFYAGHRIGAVAFHPAAGISLLVLAVLWAALLPLLIRLATSFGTGRPGRYRIGVVRTSL